MKYAQFFVAVGVVVILTAPSVVLAQSPATNGPTAPVTGMKPDRTTAPAGLREAMQKRETVKRQRRAECRAKAKAEKVSLVKRPAYIKNCVTRSNQSSNRN